MAKDKSKVLIPCYKDMDAYDMPDEFNALQAQYLGKLGAVQDIVRGIEKIIPKSDLVSVNVDASANPNVAPLLQRAFMFLEDAEWEKADIYLTESGKVIRKVKQQTKYKYKRELKYFQRAYADGNIELEEINQVLSSYRAHLVYGHTYKLQKKVLGDFVLRGNDKAE